MLEHPYLVHVCPGTLVGELDLKWARVMSSTGGVLAAMASLGLGEARPEPDANQCFYAQAITTLLWWGWGQDPRDWNRSPREVGFLLSVMALSTLLWRTARTWGLGAAVLCWLHFFSLCAWLEAGLVPHYWACFSPFQVCPGTHTLVTGVSILELVSLPAECMHWCT